MILFGIAFIIFFLLRVAFEHVSFLSAALAPLNWIALACLVGFGITAIINIVKAIINAKKK